MRTIARRRAAGVGLAAVALVAAGCSSGKSAEMSSSVQAHATSTTHPPTPPAEVTLTGEDDVAVTLTGPIAAKYATATDNQRAALGKPLTGDHNAGARQSGVVFQQFQGGVITAQNAQAGTPAYITTGKIREAWNVQRAPDGTPAITGSNGSAGPLGFPTSDANAVGDLLVSTFEHGKIAVNQKTGAVEVTVNGSVAPAGV